MDQLLNESDALHKNDSSNNEKGGDQLARLFNDIQTEREKVEMLTSSKKEDDSKIASLELLKMNK